MQITGSYGVNLALFVALAYELSSSIFLFASNSNKATSFLNSCANFLKKILKYGQLVISNDCIVGQFVISNRSIVLPGFGSVHDEPTLRVYTKTQQFLSRQRLLFLPKWVCQMKEVVLFSSFAPWKAKIFRQYVLQVRVEQE